MTPERLEEILSDSAHMTSAAERTEIRKALLQGPPRTIQAGALRYVHESAVTDLREQLKQERASMHRLALDRDAVSRDRDDLAQRLARTVLERRLLDFNLYQQKSMRTMKQGVPFIAISDAGWSHPVRISEDGLIGPESPKLWALTYASQLCAEAGEVAAAIEKGLMRDKPSKLQTLQEELGDVLWEVAAIATHFGLTLQEIADSNVKKLEARHPEILK